MGATVTIYGKPIRILDANEFTYRWYIEQGLGDMRGDRHVLSFSLFLTISFFIFCFIFFCPRVGSFVEREEGISARKE